MQGLPALHHLLLWEEAAVSLLRRPVPKRSQLHLSSQELLDECERFLRDFAHAAKDLGAPRTIYVPVAGPPPEVKGLQPSQLTPLLRLFDGRRGLSDVIEESPFRIFDTVRMIRRLRESNVLVNRPDGPRERPATGPFRPLNGPNGAPKSMLEQWAMVPDQRGIVGDRRATSRRLRPLGPAPAPTPAPIPLVARKSTSGPNRVASGEIPVAARRPTPAAASVLAVAPSVQVALDPVVQAPPPVLPPVVTAEPPAPIRARSGSGRQASLEAPLPIGRRSGSGRQAPLEDAPKVDPTPRPRRTTTPAAQSTADAFDAIEADFFAREADLYKREAIESFDDLDPDGGAGSGRKRARKKP